MFRRVIIIFRHLFSHVLDISLTVDNAERGKSCLTSITGITLSNIIQRVGAIHCNKLPKSLRIQHTYHSYIYFQRRITYAVDLIALSRGNQPYLLITWLPGAQCHTGSHFWAYSRTELCCTLCITTGTLQFWRTPVFAQVQSAAFSFKTKTNLPSLYLLIRGLTATKTK